MHLKKALYEHVVHFCLDICMLNSNLMLVNVGLENLFPQVSRGFHQWGEATYSSDKHFSVHLPTFVGGGPNDLRSVCASPQ